MNRRRAAEFAPPPCPDDPGKEETTAERHSTVALALLVLLVLTLAWLASLVLPPEEDVLVYHGYGSAILHHGLAPGLPKEYPALAGLLFLLPALVPISYQAVYAGLSGAGFALMIWAGRRFGEEWTRTVLLYSVASCFGILLSRYDVFPAVAIVFAVAAAREDRWGRAWAWAVLGGLLKLIPFLLLPGFLIHERSRTGSWPLRRVLICALVLIGWGVTQELVAPGTLLSPLSFEAHRGFEYASLPGTLTLLVTPLHARWIHAYNNIEIVGSGHAVIAVLMVVLALVGMILVWGSAHRRGLGVETTSLLALSIAVICNKSLAPQYLLWLAPLWALWSIRKTWLAAAVLSSLVYPFLFSVALHYHLRQPLLAATGLAGLRNLLLIFGTVAFAWRTLRLLPASAPSLRETSVHPSAPQTGTNELCPAFGISS